MAFPERIFGDRTAVIYPLFEGRARIGIGFTGSMSFDNVW